MTQGKIERWHQTLKNRILLENYCGLQTWSKTEVNGVRIGPSLLEPEKEASVISEAFEVWVTILTFIVQKTL
jgi:hypothetical protein